MTGEKEAKMMSLRDAKTRRERDFIALFNALWYRDFPIIKGHERKATRAMWTTHIASVVKSCADLMGFFTRFETGGRTDAVIEKARRGTWAKIEWEWAQPFRPSVNEIEKLAQAAEATDVLIYIGYSSVASINLCLDSISKKWRRIDKPLILLIIIFDGPSRKRRLNMLQTYRIRSGKLKKLREQHALPWHVPNSRWEASAEEGAT